MNEKFYFQLGKIFPRKRRLARFLNGNMIKWILVELLLTCNHRYLRFHFHSLSNLTITVLIEKYYFLSTRSLFSLSPPFTYCIDLNLSLSERDVQVRFLLDDWPSGKTMYIKWYTMKQNRWEWSTKRHNRVKHAF